METPKYLFFESVIIPRYYAVVDTANMVTLRITVNEYRANIDITFDKRRAESLMEPNNLCNQYTQSEFIEAVRANFSPNQVKIFNEIFNQLGS